MKYMHKETYYMAINHKTNNWCLSKTKYWASSVVENSMIFDSGWLIVTKAEETIKKYCDEQRRNGIFITILNSL